MSSTCFLKSATRESLINRLLNWLNDTPEWDILNSEVNFPNQATNVTKGTLLEFAVLRNELAVVRRLLERKVANAGSTLFYACLLNLAGMVDLLLEHKTPTDKIIDDRTALHYACSRGFEDIIRLFGKHAIDLNPTTPKHGTPLMDSLVNKIPRIPQLLLELNADASLIFVLENKKTLYAPFAAMTAHNHDVVKLLLDGKQFDPNKAINGVPPLYIAAELGNSLIGDLLLKAGADPNFKLAADSHTPLSIAASRNHVEFAVSLLEKGADAELPAGKENQSPIKIAILNNATASAKVLTRYGAKIPEFFANKVALIRVLDNKGNVEFLSHLLRIGMVIPDTMAKMQKYIAEHRLENPAIIARLKTEIPFRSIIARPNVIFKGVSLFSKTIALDLEGLDQNFFLTELMAVVTKKRTSNLNAFQLEKWIQFAFETSQINQELHLYLFEELLSRQSPYALLLASELKLTEEQQPFAELVQFACRTLLAMNDLDIDGVSENIFTQIESSKKIKDILIQTKMRFLSYADNTPNWIDDLHQAPELSYCCKMLAANAEQLKSFMQFVCACFIHQVAGYVYLPNDSLTWNDKIACDCQNGVNKIIELSKNKVTQAFADEVITALRKQIDPAFVRAHSAVIAPRV